MGVEARLADLGLALPPVLAAEAPVRIPFEWARVVGDRVLLSGHGALDPEGRPCPPFGRVPGEVPLEDAQASARRAGLALIASLRRAIGDLDRVQAWTMVNGFVNADPGYGQTTAVLNPLSDLLLDVFGDVGQHARTAIGVGALPLNLPVIASAEVVIAAVTDPDPPWGIDQRDR
ncbi:RidA family protein [Pseudonocardia nematodicida]|uniref:RidA family protein n=1 Tax=Pseudonocardia nematodicida TaxID=1206997 RepID=A0ABV1KDG0_9PSEU